MEIEDTFLPSRMKVSTYPNPFNAALAIDISKAKCKLNVYVADIRGRKIRSLIYGSFDSDMVRTIWNGSDDEGKTVSNGAYFIVVETDGKTTTKTVHFMK